MIAARSGVTGPVRPFTPLRRRPRAGRFSPGPGRGSGSALSLPAECDFHGLLLIAEERGGLGAGWRWDAHPVVVVDHDGLAGTVLAGVGEGPEPGDSAVVAPRGAAGQLDAEDAQPVVLSEQLAGVIHGDGGQQFALLGG